MFDMDLLTSEHHFGSPGKVVLHIFNPINNMRKSYRIFTNRPLEEMFSHYRVHYCIYVPTFTYDGVLLHQTIRKGINVLLTRNKVINLINITSL
jgi:hypothetical protein